MIVGYVGGSVDDAAPVGFDHFDEFDPFGCENLL